MRRRMIVSTALIALAAVMVLGIPLGVVESRRARSEATGRLEREADAVAAAVDERVESGRRINAVALAGIVHAGHWVVVTPHGGTPTTVGRQRPGASLAVRSGLTREARVVAHAPTAELDERIRHIWLLVGSLALAGVGAAVLLASLQARRLARPLERLARTSTQLGTGDFSARAGRAGIPEIDEVGAALDSTAVRIARLLGREREFSANVSHQLRTPLTALHLRLEELSMLEDPAEMRVEIAEALDEADRLERMIAELLAAARGETDPADAEVELGEIARRHADRLRPVCARRGRALVLRSDEPVRVHGTRGAIGQALDVLVENALVHGAGRVTVSVLHRDGQGCLRVEDEGGGIPEGAEGEIFARGSSLAGGTGIGLHLARALIEANRGRLVLARRAPAAFEIQMPAARTNGRP
jgi:signal transduction histidine kinase